MKKILVPSDFSLNAAKALNFAVHIAKQTKAEIILIHACNLIDSAFKDNQYFYKEHNQTIIGKAKKNLTLLKNIIEKTQNLSVNIKLYRGPVTESILYASEKYRADIIVMGTMGESGFKEKLFGCKATTVIANTNVPVMLVHLLSKWTFPKQILLAVNSFNEQPELMNPVFQLAKLFDATIHVAIFTDSGVSGNQDYYKQERNICQFIKKLKTCYKNNSIITTLLSGENFQDAVDSYIVKHNINIVGVINQKQTFTESIFIGNVAEKMYYNAKIPLLVIPKHKSSFYKTSNNANKYSTEWI